MKFYTNQHKFYCGIDLHARKMYLCILDQEGKTLLHKNMKTDPEMLFEAIFPYLEDIVVAVECVFCWYWISDFCAEHKIPFILGHALYMKAIHGGKTKNDKIDSYKIAALLRGGNFPIGLSLSGKNARHPRFVASSYVHRTPLRGTFSPYPKHQYAIQYAGICKENFVQIQS